jgi:hypothetical protein
MLHLQVMQICDMRRHSSFNVSSSFFAITLLKNIYFSQPFGGFEKNTLFYDSEIINVTDQSKVSITEIFYFVLA